MKLSTLLALPAALLSTVYAATEYTEHLHLKPLPGGTLYAGFSFNATTSLAAYSNQHFRHFPRSLAQILQYTHTAELHLRFSLGRWDEESWGSRPRGGLREGGNGVELWAWLEDSGERSSEERWSDLVNSLSGLFCASLNFIDSGKTVKPVLGFDPEGTLSELQTAQRRANGKLQRDLQLLHGMLPHEVVCTENLTPFLKLLPCKGKAGISSLLDGHKVFDANWQTMSVDVRPVCHSNAECEIEIQQTVDMVLDIERSKRPRDDPIPRPPPIDQITCDESKSYHAEDTCYPKPLEGEMQWSLREVFGRPIRGSCSPDGEASYDIALDVAPERIVNVLSEGSFVQAQSSDQQSRYYRIPQSANFDLHVPHQKISEQPTHKPTFAGASVHASRQITGYGQERGGMHTTLHNSHPYPQSIVYLESLPWFLRPYMHTLRLSGGDIKEIYYTPLLDRKRGTHLELLIEIPAQSTVELTYDFEKAILRYTEYPPDANRGFDVPAAVIRVLPRDNSGQGSYLRTTSLLLPLPTPDFSMPYNVIILTSTVIALGFGSIFNLLVRRFVLVEEVPESQLVAVGKRLVERGKEVLERFRGKEEKKAEGVVQRDKADGELKKVDGNGDAKKVVNGRLKERKKDR